MQYIIKPYEIQDIPPLTKLWNEIVLQHDSFPQSQPLRPAEAKDFFAMQTITACAFAETNGKRQMAGFYILHPNNPGHCSHIANASYGVAASFRGQGLGRLLVEHSLETARGHGFRALQFNAVVAENHAAIQLYLKLGFRIIGQIKEGYCKQDGSFVDTVLFIKELA